MPGANPPVDDPKKGSLDLHINVTSARRRDAFIGTPFKAGRSCSRP